MLDVLQLVIDILSVFSVYKKGVLFAVDNTEYYKVHSNFKD